MRKELVLIMLAALGAGCKMPQYVSGGEKEGVAVSYAWNHRDGKPSELLLKLKNNSNGTKRVHVGIDLSYQAFTVEQLSADTCIPAGRTFTGKMNGIYFVPQHLTAEQAASADTRVQLSQFDVEPTERCP